MKRIEENKKSNYLDNAKKIRREKIEKNILKI